MAFPFRQKANDTPRLFFVEKRHDSIQLSVFDGCRAPRMLLAHLTFANVHGRFGHASLDHAEIFASSDQVIKIQPLNCYLNAPPAADRASAMSDP